MTDSQVLVFQTTPEQFSETDGNKQLASTALCLIKTHVIFFNDGARDHGNI